MDCPLGEESFAVPATSAVPERMFCAAGNIMTKKLERVRLNCDHLEELMHLHEFWSKVREWTAIKKVCLAYWLHVTHTRAHTHKHTHSYAKNPLGRIPCFFVVTNNKYPKINHVHSRDSRSLPRLYKYTSTPLHDQVCIIIHPHQHRRTSSFLPSFTLNCILSCRDPNLF